MVSEVQLILTFAMVVFAGLSPFLNDLRSNKRRFPGSYEDVTDEDVIDRMDAMDLDDGDVIMHEGDFVCQGHSDSTNKDRDMREETGHFFTGSVRTNVSGDVVMFDAEAATRVTAPGILYEPDLWCETPLFQEGVWDRESAWM
ncbi:hypothetical protein SCHPADRAFT_1003467 [Schizopora paradoxa]|uniref:Uncharacterized protein n=1 Tax=Schizopora paradoxa TaxID=27342 RepID=A0A0H2QWX5_9AGAM|nr:hypothetical protein SCHPADRAFT_1003467 [Schizopora paradoxa]